MTAWIPDVVTGETIESVWGNKVRDRTITPFPNAAARDAAITGAMRKPGMTAYLEDTKTMSTWDGTVWVTGGAVPLGGCIDYFGSTEPTGWRFPNGQALVRATFPALFALIGTRFGVGDNSTTFNLPDKSQRVSVAPGGLLVLDAKGGEASHMLTVAEMAYHNHGEAGWHSHGVGGYQITIGEILSSSYWLNSGAVANHVGDVTFSGLDGGGNHTHTAEGANTPHNNMQPYIVCHSLMRVV